MKKCENCGAMIPDKAVFCPECGFKNQAMQVEKTSKKKSKKPWIIILCLICVAIVVFVAVNVFMKDNNDGENGVKNEKAVLYKDTIYFIKNRTLYKADKDGTKQKEITQLPHQQMGQDGDGYDNLTIYKDRLYAIRWANYSMTNEYYIFSVNLDGTDYRKDVRLPWMQGEEGEKYTADIYGFIIKNDYIYYSYCFRDDELNSTSIVYKQKIGTTKRIVTKYEAEQTPQLSGKYAYYVNGKDPSKTSQIIRMDVETGKKTSCYSGENINFAMGGMAILGDQLIVAKDTDIAIADLKDSQNSTEKKVASSSEDGVFIYNANDKEVIYYNDGMIYKMNLQTQKSEELLSEENIQNNLGIRVRSIEQLGDTLAISGYLDEDEKKEFTIFVEEKEGQDYRSVISEELKQCQSGGK